MPGLLREILKHRILTLDGAMGTQIQSLNLSADDFGGESLEGCNEILNLSRPNLIRKIHENYLQSGADIVETNSFGGTPLVLAEYGLENQSYEINFAAAKLAKEACLAFSTKDKPRFVAGSMGPTTKSICVTGGVSFDELSEHYFAQAEALIRGGCDFLLVETSQDTLNVKAALLGIDRAQAKLQSQVEIAVSGTIETTGTLLAGQSIEAFYASLEHRDLLYLGLNCATGPAFMTDHLRSLSEISKFPIACMPNAGLPDEDGHYLESPEMMAKILAGFGEKAWLNLIGGCCGTTPKHTQVFAELAKTLSPRKLSEKRASYLSGIDFVEIDDSIRPALVGERTNVIGSRKFKRLIQEAELEQASEIGRAQVKSGAHIVDVCLADPDRDELEDMKNFLSVLTKKIAAPLMIDSTDHKVVEEALKFSQGKAIINSVNLEDGEERFAAICPLARSFGAALVVGCIDDDPQQGMAVTRERKLEVAKRSYDLLVGKYGILPTDIYWDPLVFPCATGDRQYVGSAVETIEGVRLLKQNFPQTKTVLGISNVSFGLPPRGREVLNSVFLYHCVQAGLDLAIVNTEKLERYAHIPENEKQLCDDLLWNRGHDPVAAFAAHFRDLKPKQKQTIKLPLEERLAQYIIEGTKEGLISDLEEARKRYTPLEIINGPLMAGMDEVGKLFGENKLIVAEVLQSAEAMKAAVSHLENFMSKESTSLRGRMLLATVKGDVHDIGKNLVDIILSNNGFEVINLGIKIPPQELIAACKKYKPDFIGLSGLLVKSAQQMAVTAQDLAAEGIHLPMLVGGAALSQSFTDKKIAEAYVEGFVEYAKDAMTGLDLAKQIVDKERFESLKEKTLRRRADLKSVNLKKASAKSVAIKSRSDIRPQAKPPQPHDFERHKLQLHPQQVWPYINPLMLLGRHLGLKGNFVRALSDSKKLQELRKDSEFRRALEIVEKLESLKRDVQNWMQVRAVYQFVRAHSEGDTIVLDTKPEIRWSFKRQKSEKALCLADYLGDPSAGDNICLFLTTASGPVRDLAEELKAKGDFLSSHMLMALALETAEAGAEYIHELARGQWGFPDGPDMSMMDRFQAKYRGRRYSFGYPACPELEYQKQLFEVLKPEEIGVELTDGFMMSPEWSVSAMAFSHPDASYFGVKGADD